MDTNTRLRQLAGIPLTEATEMEEEKGKEKKCACPFCGTKVECDKLADHIKSDHADLIKYYKEMEKEDK